MEFSAPRRLSHLSIAAHVLVSGSHHFALDSQRLYSDWSTAVLTTAVGALYYAVGNGGRAIEALVNAACKLVQSLPLLTSRFTSFALHHFLK